MTKCPKKYKNLGLETFGNKRKVTEEMLSQFCKNDSYLKEQVNELWDTTDPETRVWENDIHANLLESYSITKGVKEVMDDYGNTFTKTCFSLDNSTNFSDSSNFKNFDWIDKSKTTARINTAEGDAEIPITITTSNDDSTHNYGVWGNFQCNEFWYIGWDKCNVYTPEKFKSNPDSSNIPAVCRGQKFVPKVSGKLRTLTLNVKGHSDAEYPLIVEIYKYPKLASQTVPLARAEYRFDTTSQALIAIDFPSPPELVKGEAYAFVLRSPLTSFEKAYAIGGWSNTCYTDYGGDTYPEGDCFLSENNGYSWIGHGKPEDVPYHEGANPPWDFGFQAVIEVSTSTYPTNTDYSVVFKTKRSNPVTYAKIIPTQSLPTGTSVEWYISQNGKNWTLLQESNNYSKTFSTDNNPVSTYIFLKTVMKTTNSANTPKITNISIHCDTQKAVKGYCKDELFRPRTSPMLGASVWSNCYCPYLIEGIGDVEVDLYKDKLVRDRFTIIAPVNIKEYFIESNFVHDYYYKNRYNEIHPYGEMIATAKDISEKEAGIIANIRSTNAAGIMKYYTEKQYLDLTEYEAEQYQTQFNSELVKVTTEEQALKFISNYPIMISFLRNHGIYVIGTNIIPLKNLSVYPVHYAYFTPTGKSPIPLSPDIDFVVDYDATDYQLQFRGENYGLEKNNVSTLTFLNYSESEISTTEKNTLYKLIPGTFEIEYNPVWVQGLKMKDFVKYDENNEVVRSSAGYTVYNGFKLDLRTETIYITKTNGVINTEYTLKLQPLPALRKVLLNPDTDSETELYENIDFTVDYDNSKILLNYDNFNTGDVIQVKYTPNLPDIGLGVAYRMTRKNGDSQVYILPNYFTVRT